MTTRALEKFPRAMGGVTTVATAPDIQRLDHLVLTVADIGRTIAFNRVALGMTAVEFGAGRHALAFGQLTINLHEVGRELLYSRFGRQSHRTQCRFNTRGGA